MKQNSFYFPALVCTSYHVLDNGLLSVARSNGRKLKSSHGTKQINSLCLGDLMETTENGFGPVLDHKVKQANAFRRGRAGRAKPNSSLLTTYPPIPANHIFTP
ncbi:hypothetical protein CIHG_07496 [Coccidioides immitis H538.4]|uniref:Uncharacterized protein n=2 Tax=Coccidioides immitis TaxID=5501 RepID=A0A0J8RZY7_COCIT|nr:hypothetical protein CIRG_02369 [Coccidioides immitis RMSCC 2394]KMU89689.1 hypothetical protein CIHG_07496 [Coccidioides immitis H538.4]